MTTSDKKDVGDEQTLPEVDTSPIGVLEKIRSDGRVWEDLCEEYGVDNPIPPWKVNLDGTCDMLSAEDCALPLLERRWEEDDLADDLYADVPFPERQLLALAHSMIRRGLMDEEELAKTMKKVGERLNSV